MTKHGHGLPRKRPGRSAKDEIDAELPELEPLDDLPVLEPLDEDEGPVKANCVQSTEDGFDTTVTIDVPEMPKKDVADAVDGPLARIADTCSAQLRHRKVLVRFGGEALIGSAVKALVAEKLAPHKPLLVVVRRGFGDEQVHEGRLPTVEVQQDTADGITKVQVATGECDAADLPVAMAPHLAALAANAAGGRFVFQFRGGAKPDATMRDAMAMALRDAGARSLAIGARVLFDRDLEDRVQCTVSGNKVTIVVSLAGDDTDTIDALSLVMPRHRTELDGKNVRYQFARESAAVQAFCVDFARDAGATLIEVGGNEDFDIVWPPLISVRTGREVELRLSPNGRSRAAVLATFVRECGEHHEVTRGQHVVIDWPADFALDAEAVECLDEVVKKLAPKTLCCTIAGDRREPFVPAPVEFGVDGDVRTIVVHTEAGKPKDLQRAIDRRLPEHAEELRGQAVRIEFASDAAVSRSLRNNLCTAVAEAGAMRLELVEGGDIDVLLPPMLAIVESDDGVVISCLVDGRDAEQQRRAVARELEGVEIALRAVTIKDSAAATAVAEYALEQGASKVLIDGAEPLQLHPPLFESVGRQGRDLRVVIESTGDEAMDSRMLDRELPDRLREVGPLAGKTVVVVWHGASPDSLPVQRLLAALRDKNAAKVLLEQKTGEAVQLHPEPKPESAAPAAAEAPAAPAPAGALLTVLGRRDESVPPIVLLGVAHGDDPAHVAAVEQELRGHLARFRGRAVLVVPQRDGVDVPIRRQNAMVEMLARVVPAGAAATLVYRGPDAQGRPHFQVLHSTLRALPVGGTFGDPRSARVGRA
ncbi:MAG TPA: hypothetical protein ENI87_00380 [bacterium]|nr:hypothetical protein [bacterium]